MQKEEKKAEEDIPDYNDDNENNDTNKEQNKFK